MVGIILCNLSLILSCSLCTCDAKDDATGDADSMTLYWSTMGIRFVENFDLVPNIGHKRKGDGVGNRGISGWWSKQVTTIGIGSKGGGDGVGSRARKGRGQMIVNSLITWVAFKEIVLSGLGASMKTPSLMAILDGLGQLAVTCP